jgi:hypothetical protein
MFCMEGPWITWMWTVWWQLRAKEENQVRWLTCKPGEKIPHSDHKSVEHNPRDLETS